MVPMMNLPMMEHIVALLKRHGFTDLTSLLYYQPEVIESHFGDGSNFGVRMNYVRAEADYGTAGSVRNATESLGLDERILVISGDVLTDFDLTAALNFHEERKARATIILTRVKNPLEFGVVMTDGDNNITRFLEKPTWGEVFSDTVNTGIYILEPDAYQMIPYKKEHDFSKDLFPVLLEEEGAFLGYIADGYWRDIGNLEEYQQAHVDSLNGTVKLEMNAFDGEPLIVGKNSIADEVRFLGKNLVGSNTRIEPGSTILNSVIGDEVVIGAGCIIENSVLWRGTKVGRGSSLSKTVSCFDVSIGNHTTIGENVFIGDRCEIGDRAEILPNVKLWPGKKVEAGARLQKSLVWESQWTRSLFTNSRISGLSNIDLTPEFCAKVGASLGAHVGMGQTVVISRDSDPVSRVIARAMSSGLMSAGVNVSDMQETPIPLTRHHLRGGRQLAGVHVRKSPMDKRKNDLIFFTAGGYDLPSNKAKVVERYFFGEDFPRAPYDKVGTIDFPSHTGEAYTKRFKNAIDTSIISNARFKIAIDYAHGITSTIFPNILGFLGAEVVSINAYLEPSRLTRARDEFEQSTRQLANVVASLHYDVGFILDSGGERIGVVDEKGEIYLNNNLLTLLTKLFLESEIKRGRTVTRIAVPVAATSEIEELARQYGVEVTFTKNTHASMMEAASEESTSYVGGTLGGFIFPEYFFAVDGMFTAAKILEMLAVLGRNLSELASELPKRVQQRRQVYCPTEQIGTVMRHAMDHSNDMKRILVDGIKMYPISTSDAWVLVLPEKEKPYCDVTVDAADAQTAERLGEEYARYVFEWRGAQ
jgi:mannose-1-phosphate guanylyltransferase/phosphomannomutase